ncbi:unnamed protein product [Moneuplotes crassus]|uniref:Uncharacterized protein n=1 Tax=Euplotes crassus TaxID=5936 RepID=A0AAD1UDL9_EUPCR|nr:unnamed protein product [Moneuplotes crassus]
MLKKLEACWRFRWGKWINLSEKLIICTMLLPILYGQSPNTPKDLSTCLRKMTMMSLLQFRRTKRKRGLSQVSSLIKVRTCRRSRALPQNKVKLYVMYGTSKATLKQARKMNKMFQDDDKKPKKSQKAYKILGAGHITKKGESEEISASKRIMNNLNSYLNKRKEFTSLVKKQSNGSSIDINSDLNTLDKAKYFRNPHKNKRIWSAKAESRKIKERQRSCIIRSSQATPSSHKKSVAIYTDYKDSALMSASPLMGLFEPAINQINKKNPLGLNKNDGRFKILSSLKREIKRLNKSKNKIKRSIMA